jgi:hypothetical protein
MSGAPDSLACCPWTLYLAFHCTSAPSTRRRSGRSFPAHRRVLLVTPLYSALTKCQVGLPVLGAAAVGYLSTPSLTTTHPSLSSKSNHSHTYKRCARKSNDSHTYAKHRGVGYFSASSTARCSPLATSHVGAPTFPFWHFPVSPLLRRQLLPPLSPAPFYNSFISPSYLCYHPVSLSCHNVCGSL